MPEALFDSRGIVCLRKGIGLVLGAVQMVSYMLGPLYPDQSPRGYRKPWMKGRPLAIL